MGDARYPETIEIRPALPEDADGITRTFLDSAKHHAELDPERYWIPAAEVITARYREGRRGSVVVHEAEFETGGARVMRDLFQLVGGRPGTEVTVDLVSKTVQCGNIVAPFEIDDYTRWRLLEGLDDIGLTLKHEPDITAYEATRPSFKPKTLPARLS